MSRGQCDSCEQPIEFPPEMIGQQTECPHCGAKTVLAELGNGPTIRIPEGQGAGPIERQVGSSSVMPVATRIIENVERVIVGKHQEIVLTLMAYLAEGHVLLEDVPGVAKTILARSLARSIGCSFKRIQCTPDLLPNDITGTSIFNPKTIEFEFRKGPVFAQIVLADEINRATPRAQSALLEAMAERRVTADGVDFELTPPFFLIATQNPIDHEGTFPLPEAQLDRFFVRLNLGYPGFEQEMTMLERLQLAHPVDSLEAVATAEEVACCQDAVREIYVDPKLSRYIVTLVQMTRTHPDVSLGGSPRASIAAFRAAQAYAAIHGYDFAMPDDVKQIVPYVLGHRILLKPESRLRKRTVGTVIEEIMDSVAVPEMAASSFAR